MSSLDELPLRIAAQIQDIASQWKIKLQDLSSNTIPVAETFTILYAKLPHFDPQNIVTLCQQTWHRLIHSFKLALVDTETGAVPANFLLAVLPVAFGLILSLVFFLRRGRPQSTGAHDVFEPLVALTTVITPATSIWPAQYLHIARHSLRSRRLIIPLRALYEDLVSGDIELRTPAVDLPILMSNTHRTQGWRLEMNAGASWTLSVILRIIFARCASLIPRARPALLIPQEHHETLLTEKALPGNHDLQAKTVAVSTTCVTRSAATGGRATLILDVIPYSHICAYVRAFQVSLPSGSPAMLGFSTLGSSVSLFSSSFVLAAVPFLPRKYITKRRLSSDRYQPCPAACRTIAPLMTSLDSIMKTLTSGRAPLVIESVQNVSDDYARCLRQYVDELTNDPGVRQRFIARWGVEGWREERFLATWEESLCSAGLLARWVILARK